MESRRKKDDANKKEENLNKKEVDSHLETTRNIN
jgi:hypothetical protein